jgi:hypothetical protein
MVPFNGCEPEFIKTICKAGCEFSSKHGTMITIHPSEKENIERLGGIVNENNFIIPIKAQTVRGFRKCCPFHTPDGLCKLHYTSYKPFGCIASPFTLNKHNTLIIRYRYFSLGCYNKGKKLPAYIAFKESLNLILGEDNYKELCTHLTLYDKDILMGIKEDIYKKLVDNDIIKKLSKINV